MCFEPASRSTLDDDDAEEAAFICDSITKEDVTLRRLCHARSHGPKSVIEIFSSVSRRVLGVRKDI